MNISAWQCDICKNVFHEIENDPLFKNPGSIYIKFDDVNMYFPEYEVKLKTVCLDCRKKLLAAIDEIVP